MDASDTATIAGENSAAPSTRGPRRGLAVHPLWLRITHWLHAVAVIVIIVLSGLVLWKSVQFPVLRELMGGYEGARRVHFFAMAYLVAFFIVHVVMVALVPSTLRLMILGRPRGS